MEKKNQQISRATYKRIKSMDRVQLSNYITRIYLTGFEAGRKAGTPDVLFRTIRELLLDTEGIGEIRANAIMKKLGAIFAPQASEEPTEETAGTPAEDAPKDEEKCSYKPKIIKGKVHDTGYPVDGCVMLFSMWDYDNHDSWHLYGWDDDVDDAVMRTMHQTDEIYMDDTPEQFAKRWKAKEYEPDGAFCLDLDKVEVIEVLQEEETA